MPPSAQARLKTALLAAGGGILLLVALHDLSCSGSSTSEKPPLPSSGAASPEVFRTANRIADNEGKDVVIEGFAVEIAGRACVHLDRTDAIVPVAGLSTWDTHLRDRLVRARGRLSRHAFENDPVTGVASLELVQASVESIVLPADGRIRTAPELQAAEGTRVDVEGLAYGWHGGAALAIYGGAVYLPDLPRFHLDVSGKTIVVHGTVRHPEVPSGAPPADGSWAIESTGWELVPAR